MKKIKSISLALSCSLLFAGCTTTEKHGYFFKKNTANQIKIGKTTKNSVIDLMGSPTIQDNVTGQSTWFYIGKKQNYRGPLSSDTQSKKVLKITFEDDVVASIDEVDPKKVHYKKIETVSDTTEASGKTTSVLEQLFGNIGRFSKKKDKK